MTAGHPMRRIRPSIGTAGNRRLRKLPFRDGPLVDVAHASVPGPHGRVPTWCDPRTVLIRELTGNPVRIATLMETR